MDLYDHLTQVFLFFNHPPPLFLNDSKCFGVIISFNLSSKGRQTIGIIYRNFYQHASSQIHLALYHSLVFESCHSLFYLLLLSLGPINIFHQF